MLWLSVTFFYIITNSTTLYHIVHTISCHLFSLTEHQTLFRKAYTYKSQQSKPPVEKPKEVDTPTEANPEASSEETAEKASTSSGGHSVTKQLPMAVWMSLSPYGSCQLQPLILWVNIQYLGEQYIELVQW